MSGYDDWGTYLDPELEGAELTAEERAALDGIAVALGDEATWSGPSADLRDRLMAEAAALRTNAGHVEVVPFTDPRSRQSTAARRLWIAAAGVAAAIVVVVVLALPGPNVPTFDLAGSELTPTAAATVGVEPVGAGVAITLDITGLAPTGPGEYYAAWLSGDTGSVGIGSFHLRAGGIPIGLWSGVDTSRYPILRVTLQQEGEPTGSSGVVVLEGRVSD
ncbi:MAG: anti-sigma factor [Acidimicrobiia bacterium]|nr:anti-sigma factor [Acidimicrobiia bacterium]